VWLNKVAFLWKSLFFTIINMYSEFCSVSWIFFSNKTAKIFQDFIFAIFVSHSIAWHGLAGILYAGWEPSLCRALCFFLTSKDERTRKQFNRATCYTVPKEEKISGTSLEKEEIGSASWESLIFGTFLRNWGNRLCFERKWKLPVHSLGKEKIGPV
jgi:hypothetical protein